jgi:signal transduction histidine kinase
MRNQNNSNEADSSLESELVTVQLQSAKILALLGMTLVPFSLILDWFIYPGQRYVFLSIRCAVSILCFCAFMMARHTRFQYQGKSISLFVLLIIGTGSSAMIWELGYTTPYYAGLNLIYLASMLIPWGMNYSLTVCGIIFGEYLLSIFKTGILPGELPAFINNTVFQIETIVIAIAGNFFLTAIRKKEIAARKRIADQAKELEERDKYKREFIANITHELKTPLSIVIGNVDIIMETIGDRQPQIMEQARQVQQAAFQLANHVDRIIAVSSVDDPMVKPDLQNYNYCGIVHNVFSLFAPKAREEKIAYRLNCPDKPMVVSVDVVRIEEVLTNLIQNAFKFTDEGGAITVSVACDGQQVVTEVADTGVGISAEKQVSIFDRMFQADGVLSKRHGGMGLGLYIVKKNIELLGGSVGVDSREGRGTSFRFSLPLFVDQTAPVKNEPFKGDERRETQRRSGKDRRAEERRRRFEYQQCMGLDDLAKMSFTGNIELFENMNPSLPTVLIVEDNPGMMKVVIEALRQDYNLLLARDAFEALEKLKKCEGRVSLILSDIMMPGMSGFDFCGKVMENETWKSIPLIFVTALMSEQEQLKGFALGATDYITKPYNIKILKEKVDNWISRRQYESILKNMSQELEARVRQLSRVKDIILHEIRNPLTVISTADSLISMAKEKKQENADAKIGNYLESLRSGVEALHSVLETTRQLDMDALAIVRKAETVESIVREAVTQVRHLIGEIRLSVLMDGAGGVRVNADRRMLVQVLVNIIRNAVEAVVERKPSDGGAITVSCVVEEAKKVVVKISDNGVGMNNDQCKNLFRFKYTTKHDGTGIGLHLSNMLVKLHDGSIRVESQKGSGSTFAVYLPVC